MNTRVRIVRCPQCRKLLTEFAEVPVYKCGGCDKVLQAKKPKNGTTDATSEEPAEDSSVEQKVERLSDDKEASKDVENDPDRDGDHNAARSSTELSCHEDPESSPETEAHIDAGQETHLSYPHSRIDQNQNQDQDQEHKQDHLSYQHSIMDQEHELGQDQDDRETYTTDGASENCKDGVEFGESVASFAEKRSSSERSSRGVEEPSQAVSRGSSFKSLIAEKLLETRRKKAVTDEDDGLSEDETANLTHRRTVRRFDRVSSVDTLENDRFGNRSRYSYEGSVSSSDGGNNEDRMNQGRSEFGANRALIGDSGNRQRAKWRQEIHPRRQRGKDATMGSETYLHGNASPSPPRFNDRSENPKLEKFQLLKMVKELQDELDRTTVSNTPQFPSYHVPNYSRYPPRYGQRMAFSGEVATGAYSPYQEYHPQDRHFSAQLPPQAIFHNSGAYGGPYGSDHSSPQDHPGLDFSLLARTEPVPRPNHRSPKKRHSAQLPPQAVFHNNGAYSGPYGSDHLSPQHHPGPDFSLLARTEPVPRPNHLSPKKRHSAQLPPQAIFHNNGAYGGPYGSDHSSPQHHPGPDFSLLARTEPVLRPNHRSPKKRHVRPISSGAPLIACYRCSEILEMPQCFLLFKRRFHRLRCGACSKALRFVLVDGSQVARYDPEETVAAPPSSEVEDYDGGWATARAEPVSCSDRSFQKSYSTETDKFRSCSDRSFQKSYSTETDKTIPDRKLALKVPMAVTDANVASSSGKKVTSEIEEIEPVASGSPLHRLMGYASPSKVIRG